MTMCFSSLIATTFVLTLLGLVPYLGLCILVVKVSLLKVQLEGSQTTDIQSPRYGTNPKSVDTKVVAINELKHIVIGSFCIKWIFLSFLGKNHNPVFANFLVEFRQNSGCRQIACLGYSCPANHLYYVCESLEDFREPANKMLPTGKKRILNCRRKLVLW